MNYPWVDNFIIQAADPADPTQDEQPDAQDTPPDEATGTNEPVVTDETDPNADPSNEPDPSLAQDIADADPTMTDVEPDTSGLQTQIEDLKKQIEDLKSENDMETQIQDLKRRLDNISVNDETNLNDDIFQSASREVNYIKRALRRVSGLTGSQRQMIEAELEKKPQQSCQEIAANISKSIGASEQDIIDFIRNSDYRFRHRHAPEASVIDWNSLK